MKLIVVDVDGTLTDGTIIYDNNGNELKKFSARDAAGFFIAKAIGIKTMVLTGRESKATMRRTEEMKVDYVFQNVINKGSFLKKFIEENGYSKNDIIYVGDDLNDLSAMKLCGHVGCPADSCQEIKEIADYVSSIKGGQGAFRDVVEHYLRAEGAWESIAKKIYDCSEQ